MSLTQDQKGSVHIIYDQDVRSYHSVIASLVSKFLSDRSSLLDIGCGVGNLLCEVYKRNPTFELTAADIDNICLEETLKKVALSKAIVVSDLDIFFNETEDQFDGIIMSHVLEHTLQPINVLHGVMGLLKEGGVLFLAVPNTVKLPVIVKNIFRKKFVNLGHVYSWDRSHWINFLEVIMKLNVICYAEDSFPLPLPKFLKKTLPVKYIEQSLVRFLPWFSNSHIAVIRK